ESKAKLGDFSPELSSGQIGDLSAVFFTLDKSPNHVFPGFSHDIGCNSPELYVGIFQNLVNPIYHRGSLVNQLTTVSSQVSKLPLGFIGNKASLKKPALEKVRDPLGVFNICLSSRDMLHMPGIYQKDVESTFKNVVDGLPINPGRFHGHMSDLLLGHPNGKS